MNKRSLRPPGKPGRPKKIVSDIPVGEKTIKKSIVKAITPVKSSLEPKKESKNPKTLAELKAMCPKELKGIERSQWIAEKRVKYGV